MAEEKDKAKESKTKRAVQSAGAEMRKEGQAQMAAAEARDDARSDEKSPNSSPRLVDSYKRGGKIRKPGRAQLHKGERLKRKKSRYTGRL